MITTVLIVACFAAPGSAFVVPNAAPRFGSHANADSHPRLKNKSELSMADATYALDPKWVNNGGSFLFQYSDWPSYPSLSRRSGLSRSVSFLDQDEYEDTTVDDSLLSYLPYVTEAPLTNKVLKQITSKYINSAASAVALLDISQLVNTINEEYKTTNVPVRVGDKVFEDEIVSKILSFAALHRLPKQVALLLLNSKQVSNKCRDAFLQGGWESVEFPNGLGICLQKQFRSKSSNDYSPLSWRLSRRKRKAAAYAQAAVEEAALVPPPLKKVSRTEFLKSMQQELTQKPSLFQDAQQLLFFPQRSRVSKIWNALVKSAPKQVAFWMTGTVRVTFKVARWAFRKVQRLLVSGFTG